MKQNKQLFKDIVLRFAEESKCESFKVACIAVKNNRIIASGVNGTLPGSVNCKEYMMSIKPEYMDYLEWKKTEDWRIEHHQFSEVKTLHAEQQVLVSLALSTLSIKDCDIYVTHMPCIQCAKLLAFIKPRVIYYIYEYDKADKESMELLYSAGIKIENI